MGTYYVTSRDTRTRQDNPGFFVRGHSYIEAAQHAAERLYGHRTTISVVRTTGHSELSGFFQAYLPVPTRHGGGRTSYGDPFHLAPC